MAVTVHEKVINKKSLVSFYYTKQEFSALKFYDFSREATFVLSPPLLQERITFTRSDFHPPPVFQEPNQPLSDCEKFHNRPLIGKDME